MSRSLRSTRNAERLREITRTPTTNTPTTTIANVSVTATTTIANTTTIPNVSDVTAHSPTPPRTDPIDTPRPFAHRPVLWGTAVVQQGRPIGEDVR